MFNYFETSLSETVVCLQESPEVRMALTQAHAPDPAALAAYWAEYEDLCRQISPSQNNDNDDNPYEGTNKFIRMPLGL